MFSGNNFSVRFGDTEIGIAWVSPLTSRSLPDRSAVETVVLRRAVSTSRLLWDWHQGGRSDPAAQRVVIELQDSTQTRAVVRWILHGARPIRWTGPELDASAQRVATEEIELTYERLEWENGE